MEQGLAGFSAQITDDLGDVTTDIYGNPLCTRYDGEDPVTFVIPATSLDVDMMPVVATLGGQCLSDANGDLSIPHLGTNRYALLVVPAGWCRLGADDDPGRQPRLGHLAHGRHHRL